MLLLLAQYAKLNMTLHNTYFNLILMSKAANTKFQNNCDPMFKGTVAWDFLDIYSSPNISIWSLWYFVFIKSLRKYSNILSFCAMKNCAEQIHLQWFTTLNQFLSSESLHGNFHLFNTNFSAVNHCIEVISTQWINTQNHSVKVWAKYFPCRDSLCGTDFPTGNHCTEILNFF